jgi:hypothetical protein
MSVCYPTYRRSIRGCGTTHFHSLNEFQTKFFSGFVVWEATIGVLMLQLLSSLLVVNDVKLVVLLLGHGSPANNIRLESAWSWYTQRKLHV